MTGMAGLRSLGQAASEADEYRGAARFEAALPLEQLQESAQNPRQRFDEEAMRELTESVREKGVVTPLLVRPLGLVDGAPRYEIAAGHRRARAARAAGRTTVPALIRGMADEEFLELLVLENDQREDVHALEEAQGYQSLLRLPGYDVAKIAARVGRSPKYVYDRLKLLALIPEAQRLFLENRFTAGHAILLARLKPADQERAIDPAGHAVFQDDHGLFDEPAEGEEEDPHAVVKARSVRELQQWIQDRVLFTVDQVDRFLFPDTAEVLDQEDVDESKVLLVTRAYMASDAVRHAAGGRRIYGEAAWKRADGKVGSKTCDRSRAALVACGPGQGEALKVCANKEKCSTHWSAWQKERAKRQAVTASSSGDGTGASPSSAAAERAAAERRENEERERVDKAIPEVLRAIAAAVMKAPTGASSQLGKIVIDVMTDFGGLHAESALADSGVYPSKEVPPGKTAQDLIRHLAFWATVQEFTENVVEVHDLVKRARAFGVDAKKILDRVAPVEKPAVQTSAKAAKPAVAGKARGKKKARR